MQHLSAPGDPGGVPAAAAGETPGGPRAAHHGGGRKDGLFPVCGMFQARPIGRWRASGETAVSFQGVSLSYRAVKGEPHTVFQDLDLNIRKGGEGGPDRLQRGRQIHPDEADGGAAEAPCRHSPRSLERPLGTKRRRICPGRSPWCIKTRRRCSSRTPSEGTSPTPWRCGTSRSGRGAPGNCWSGSGSRSSRTGTAASCPAGRCAGPAWLSAIALNPGILLLDEPTANLDIATRREIMAVLDDMKDIIQTAVIATHDMQLVCQWAERIIVLRGGRVVADGPGTRSLPGPTWWSR